jgi:hypothetical protein
MKSSIRKILVVATVIMIMVATTVTAYAITPKFNIPNIPSVPNISPSVKVELPNNFWDNWFKEHPLNIDFSKININFG